MTSRVEKQRVAQDTASAEPVRAQPQQTSLAIWAVPSPVIAGARFAIRAGAKSTADDTLSGLSIEVCDDTGAIAARGRLSNAPLPGTAALYWTEMELVAPAAEGLAEWSVRFAADGLDLPHDGAATAFSVAVVQEPEYTLRVKVIECGTALPISDVVLRLGAFRGITGATGVAEIRVPPGRHELCIWKVGYEAQPGPIEIASDVSVEIEAVPVAEEDPDARWKM